MMLVLPRRYVPGFSYAAWVQLVLAVLTQPAQAGASRSLGEVLMELAYRDTTSPSSCACWDAFERLCSATAARLPSAIREPALVALQRALEDVIQLALKGRYAAEMADATDATEAKDLSTDLARASYPCIKKLSMALYFVN